MPGGRGYKEKGRKGLAWTSFVIALVGGAALASTPISGLIVGVIHMIGAGIAMVPFLHVPASAVPVVLFTGTLVAMAIDMFNDGEPNQIALYTIILLPTLARSVHGSLSESVTSMTGAIQAQVSQSTGAWLGVTGGAAMALVCIVVSLLMARRVVRGGR